MLPLARAMRDAAHEVAFLSGPEIEDAVGREGFELHAAGPEFSAFVTEALTRYPDTSFATPDDQQRFGFERLFSEVRVDMAGPDAFARAGAFAPDLVVNEVADFVGPLVAARIGVPNATVGVGLVLRDDWLQLAAAGVASAWAGAGLDAPSDAGVYRSLYLNQFPRSLQRPLPGAAPNVSDLRPVVFGADATLPGELDHLGRARPLVYVTFGTMFGDLAALRTVVDGLAPLDADVLVTVGYGIDPPALDIRHGNVAVRQFVPQGALLSRCRLVVTHGGAGSVLGPLAFGVPLVVIPMGADQQENAEQVAAVGAGRVIDPAQVQAEVVGQVARAVLGDEEIARRACALSTEIAAMPAPADVVPLLEEVAAGTAR